MSSAAPSLAARAMSMAGVAAFLAVVFTIASALHYVVLVQQRLREHTHALPPARTPAT